MKIEDNTVVLLSYTLTGPDGEVLDSSTREAPFAYLHGHGGIIPGLEHALSGRGSGDQFEITIAPKDGYGERIEELVSEVSKDLFDEADGLQVGMTFNGESDQGTHMVTVTEVAEDTVTIDANPPLAGVPLTFAVEVLEVRKGTAEELEHGHPHGPGGHHHH